MASELSWSRFKKAFQRAFRLRTTTQPPHQVSRETVRQQDGLMIDSRSSLSLSLHISTRTESSSTRRALMMLVDTLIRLERALESDPFASELNGSRGIRSALSQLCIIIGMSEMRASLALDAIEQTMLMLHPYVNRFLRSGTLHLNVSRSTCNSRDYAAAHHVRSLSLARTAVAAMNCMKELALLILRDPSLLTVGQNCPTFDQPARLLEKAERTVIELIVAWRSDVVPDWGFGSLSKQALSALRAVRLGIMESMPQILSPNTGRSMMDIQQWVVRRLSWVGKTGRWNVAMPKDRFTVIP